MHKCLKKIYLAHTRGISRKKEIFRDNEDAAWLFFGRNYSLFLELEKTLPSNFRYISISKKLHTISKSLRRNYIDYIGKLGNKFNSFEWWTSKIAEKNTAESPLFLNICYLEVLKDILNSNYIKESKIYIVSESYALLKLIYDLLNSKRDYEVLLFSRQNLFIKNVEFLSAACYRILIFLKKQLLLKAICFFMPPKNGLSYNKEYIFVRTWIAKSFFLENGGFRDAYFGNLPDTLIKKGFDIKIVPIILTGSINKSLPEVIRWLRAKDGYFVIPSDFYSLYDFFKVIFMGLKQYFLIKKIKFNYAGQDLSLLFYEELYRTIFAPILLEFNLYYFFIKNLAKKNISIKNFIFTFENMVHEKPLIMGIRRFSPETKAIGYQHCVLYPMTLCQYMSRYEEEVMPLPDKIVCCGEFFKYILFEEGYSDKVLVSGPALRYDYLHRLKGMINSEKPCFHKTTILVTGVENPYVTSELLNKVYLAFQDGEDINVWFKPHPIMKRIDIENLFGKGPAKKDFFRITYDGMDKSLPDADCLIAISTGAIFDALALGVPVIRLRRETDITMDPADWLDERPAYFGKQLDLAGISFTANSPSEIKERFSQVKGLSSLEKDKLCDIGKAILNRCFSPFDRENYNAFL